MQLIEAREIRLEMRDLLTRESLDFRPRPRSPGYHLSGILRYVAELTGKLDGITKAEVYTGDYPWRWAMGVMFEEFWFSLHPHIWWQPGERNRDGVSYNIDGISTADDSFIFPNATIIEETKCTEKKVRSGEDFIKGEWLYMHQGRAYAYCYRANLVRWTVLYYRGRWDGLGPVVMQYLVLFTDEELRQTWTMVQRFKNESAKEI